MKSIRKHIPLSLLILVLALFAVLPASTMTASAANRDTDVTTPSAGKVLILAPGGFVAADVTALLNQVNSYRMEACQNGYPTPGNPSVKLTAADYSPLQWSGDLEWIAQTRAAEGTMYQSHTRPNGNTCFTVKHNGVTSWAESLAWNGGTLPNAVNMWYGEKADWVSQKGGVVTGHYTQMIDPKTKYIGIGSFVPGSGATQCTAAEFSSDSNLSTTPQGLYGQYYQVVEVPSSAVSIRGKSTVAVNKLANYQALNVSILSPTGATIVTPSLHYNGSPTWSSSNTAVATISSTGILTAKAVGTTEITLRYHGIDFKKLVTVTNPAKGTSFSVGGMQYKITNSAGEVELSRCLSPVSGFITTPSTVTYQDISYKVTSIGTNAYRGQVGISACIIGPYVRKIGATAFAGCKGMVAVLIPPTVTTIKSKAFYSCRSLRTVVIQTTRLSSGRVGKKAFGNAPIKTVKVPSSKRRSYKKWLYKKGLRKKAKIR